MNKEQTYMFYFKDKKKITLSAAELIEMKETLKCSFDVLLTYQQQQEINMQASVEMED